MSTPGVGYVVEVTDPRSVVEARLYGLFTDQAVAVAFARQVTAHLIPGAASGRALACAGTARPPARRG